MTEWIDLVLQQALRNDSQLILFAILIVSALIVLDAISKVASLRRKQAGIKFEQIKSALPGRNWLPARDFVSTKLSLAGKPDGLLLENGFTVPVEFKPMGKKVRDRYIIQMLVYLRLIEEFTGKRPPYGYLILGPKGKQIKIYNSEKKQIEIDNYLSQMRAIADEKASAIGDATEYKCQSCKVNSQCQFRYKS